jgi:multidrug resistance efflux pump
VTQRVSIPVPWRLMLKRAQYQLVPVGTMILCTMLVAWLWVRNARSLTVFGEVNAVRVSIESKYPAMLLELPRQVEMFDTVRKGQIIARLDVDVEERQLERLEAQLDSLKKDGGDPATTTRPVSMAMRDIEAQMGELRARIDARDIKSPIDGTVMQIFDRPGESAKLAMPIMTIAADKGDFIICYVRQNQVVRPAVGMAVTVRSRASSSGYSFTSHVSSVAPQVQALPERYQRDRNIVEYALPVQVELPPEADVRPGEMVDVVFHPSQTK